MKKPALPQNLADWVTARTKLRLSHAHVQMARELGMNPKKLGGKATSAAEPWKLSLPDYIAELYERRFGRRQPETTLSIEDAFRARTAEDAARKAERRAEQQKQRAASVDRALGFAMTAEVSLESGAVHMVPAPAGRISDALLDLARLIDDAPETLSIGPFTDLIEFVADVWNVTLLADEANRAAARDALVARFAETEGVELGRAREVIADIEARKRERYGADHRRISRTAVEQRGRNYLITASSLSYRDENGKAL